MNWTAFDIWMRGRPPDEPIRCEECREAIAEGDAVEADGLTFCRACDSDWKRREEEAVEQGRREMEAS